MKPVIKHRSLTKPKNTVVADIQQQLKASEGELAHLLDSNERTIYRWVAEGGPEYYEPILRWKNILELARKSLQQEAIGEWFHEPNRALGGSIPIRLAADPRGFQIVEDLLGNAAHGNFL